MRICKLITTVMDQRYRAALTEMTQLSTLWQEPLYEE